MKFKIPFIEKRIGYDRGSRAEVAATMVTTLAVADASQKISPVGLWNDLYAAGDKLLGGMIGMGEHLMASQVGLGAMTAASGLVLANHLFGSRSSSSSAEPQASAEPRASIDDTEALSQE